MPYAARPMADDEKNKQVQNISGGAGAGFAVNVPGQEPNQKSSGQYTNIQSYLDANKDQAAQMGQNVTNKVDESASGAQSKIQNFGAQAPKVEAYDPNEAYKNLGSLNDQQKSQYRDVKATGGYSGPQTIDQLGGYDDVQKSYNEAKTRLDNSKTETGQQQLLRDVYARPSYSGGENKLDQVLVQNNSDSRQSLENLNQKYAGLNDLFKNTNESVGTAIESSKAQADANKKSVLAGEQEQWNNLLNPIQARADQLNQQNPQIYQSVASDISDDQLSADTLQRLGLSAGQNLYDINLNSYLTPNQTQFGLNDVANSTERSKYQALTDLVQDPTRSQISDSGLSTNPFSFDKEKFESDVSGKKANAEAEYSRVKANGISPKVAIEQSLPAAYAYLSAQGIDINSDYWKNQPINSSYFGQIKLAEKIANDYREAYKPDRQIKAGG